MNTSTLLLIFSLSAMLLVTQGYPTPDEGAAVIEESKPAAEIAPTEPLVAEEGTPTVEEVVADVPLICGTPPSKESSSSEEIVSTTLEPATTTLEPATTTAPEQASADEPAAAVQGPHAEALVMELPLNDGIPAEASAEKTPEVETVPEVAVPEPAAENVQEPPTEAETPVVDVAPVVEDVAPVVETVAPVVDVAPVVAAVAPEEAPATTE